MSEYITIPLSQKGKYAGMYEAVISSEDSDLVMLSWCVKVALDTQYVLRSFKINDKWQSIPMHRIILERILGRPLGKDEHCDHIDRNGLNNTRENLRLVTHSQNQMNRGKAKSNKSGYKGVYWDKNKRKYVAQISKNKKYYRLGYFDDPEDAYRAYCLKEKELFSGFLRQD